MKKLSTPQGAPYWLLQAELTTQQIKGNITTDVVIVGGGMAGITAAQQFCAMGKKVVLLERSFCGAGASGKSSGFITPNAELGLTHFVDVYGEQQAAKVWDFVTAGVALIKKNIGDYNIDCDYVTEDTVIVANSIHGLKELAREHANYQKLHYASTLYDKPGIETVVGSTTYHGGMRFGGTFGINTYRYLQAMKKVLLEQGVQIYEENPVTDVQPDHVQTPFGNVYAENIVMCVDRFLPELGLLKQKVYQAETFIAMSTPLDDATIKKMFPQERVMVWDTDFVYQYYRMTGDNRLLIGGSTLLRTYHLQTAYNPTSVYKKLTNYVRQRFPQVSLDFEYMWPGLIGSTQDIKPIVGADSQHPHIYYVTGATGLPWAAALGAYAAESICKNRRDFDEIFSPSRPFLFTGIMQTLLRKPNAFGLANLISLKR